MKLREDQRNRTFIFIAFFLFSVLLPVYDPVNGFYNLLFHDYNLTWHDGRSPANFHVVKNIAEEGMISFPEGYLIGDTRVEDHFDFIRAKNGRFYPIFNYPADYFYASVLTLFPITNDLQLFKGMVVLNITIYSFSLLLFYSIQKLLGLSTNFSLMSTLVGGVATGILIYSRYLFVQYTLINFLFLLLIFCILKKRKSFRNDLIVCITFSVFLIFLWYEPLVIMFFLLFSYFFLKFKVITSKKTLLIPILAVPTILSILYSPYHGVSSRHLSGGIEDIVKVGGIPIVRVFPDYISALDFSIYGYHNQTSIYKLSRNFAYVYAFKERPGNALFLRFFGLFASLFGLKGIVYNSPFLIFSLFGIFAFRKEEKRNLLLIFIILFLLIYGFFHPIWYGGGIPRYNRFMLMPALLLTFFSFYYIQKTKKSWIRLVFLVFVILSVLNVSSLAIRADWTYEHPTDLVSYDLVLWPWYPFSTVERVGNKTIIRITSADLLNWKLGGDDGCKAKFTGGGLMTDPCFCIHDSWAEREVELKKEVEFIEVRVCTVLAGGDGAKGFIFVDDELIGEILVESFSCTSKNFSVSLKPGKHILKLKSGTHGNCTGDITFWKSITFKE